MRFTLIHGSEKANPLSLRKRFGVRVPVYPPLGVLYLGGVLERGGHEVDIIDFFVDKDPYDAIDKSIQNTDAVGLSVDNVSYTESAYIAQYIKEKDPHLSIVIGGPHCTLYKEQSLVNIPTADVSVNGDGEHAIASIADAFEGTKSLGDIPGIFYRENSKIAHGKPAELIENLDTVPFPARHLVTKYEYGESAKLFLSKKLTSLTTTRGCPYRCRYCTQHAVSHSYRERSVENVMSEFHDIIEQGYQSVMFADNMFLANQKRAHKILDGLIAMESPLELLIGGNRPDVINRPLAEKMRQAGVKYLSIGFISGNQDMLDFLNKQITIEQIKKVAYLCDELGFFVHGSFILGAPFEDEQHFKNTINLACSLPLDSVTFYLLGYRRGSTLWQEASNEGKIPGDVYETLPDKEMGLSPFTKQEILRYRRWAMQRFFYRPYYPIHLMTKALKNHDTRMVNSTIDELMMSLRLPKV
jgi:anaerobic magnesium-protoporphyrin IX monomethyl ester cyclase